MIDFVEVELEFRARSEDVESRRIVCVDLGSARHRWAG